MEFDYFPDYTEPLADRACCHPLELYDYIFATGTTPFHVSDKFKSAALKRVMMMALLVPDLELGLIRWIEAFGFDMVWNGHWGEPKSVGDEIRAAPIC